MASFKNADAGIIVDQLIKTIQEQRDYLSEIDGKIGDGDHGINMNKGFTMCEDKLKGKTYNLSEGLSILGETLLDDIGGSMGPLYGMLFDEMAMACEDAEEIDAEVFGEMVTNAVEGLQEISPAKVGDKSLIDTLVPAKEALSQQKKKAKSLRSAWRRWMRLPKKGGSLQNISWQRSDGQAVWENGPEEFWMQEPQACYFIVTGIGKAAIGLLK